MSNIVIVGATSAIAERCARLWATLGNSLVLVGRNPQRLEDIATDLKVRAGGQSCTIATYVMDATDVAAHGALLQHARDTLGEVDVLFIAHGTLPDQAACEASVEKTLAEIANNGTSVVALATRFGQYFAERGRGTLAAIGSVAGDRGRQSNYVYGAAKGLVDHFFQGLRNRLFPLGVRVLLVKPGFVDTPMTAAFPKGPLWAKPETVAARIVEAVSEGDDVVYVPSFWRFIMFIIRHVPETIFKRLKL